MRIFIVLLLLLMPLPALAQEAPTAELGIVAIVNDEVVTSMDVADRVAFVVATTQLPNNPETVQRLIPQVTRQLIDEKLQMQEASRLGITVDQEKINQAIDAIAQRQGRSKEELYQDLILKGVPKDVFEEQIQAQISWQSVIARAVRSTVKVSDAEVERARLSDSLKLTAQGAIEVEIVSLVLPVSTPKEEAEVKALAQKLVSELRGGAQFDNIAAQFGAQSIQEPTWVALADMEPGLSKALSKAVPGTVSNPARTPDGYVIIKLLNRRGISSAEVNDSQLLIKDILLKLAPDDATEAAELSLMIAKEVARNPGTCKSEQVAGADGMEALDIQVGFIQAQFSELHDAIQKMVANLSVGGVSEPFASPEGIRVLMLCERTDAPPEMATAEATYSQLMNKKLELETQKYMRNLRRDAFIEFRR